MSMNDDPEVLDSSAVDDPLYKEIGLLLRKAIKISFKSLLAIKVSNQAVHLALLDGLSNSEELGMNVDRVFSASLYLHTLESSPKGLEYINFLLLKLNTHIPRTDLTSLEGLQFYAAFFALRSLLLSMQALSRGEFKADFSIGLVKSNLAAFYSLFVEMVNYDTWVPKAKYMGERELKDLEKKMDYEHFTALKGSRALVYDLCTREMREGRILKEAVDLLDLYVDSVDIYCLWELLSFEYLGMEDSYLRSTRECDMRGFSSQIVKNARNLQKDPSLPALLPAKVIEFKDYIPDFRETKWTDTFKKRLRRARAEAEKRRAAPGPLRLTEYILPVNDIDD